MNRSNTHQTLHKMGKITGLALCTLGSAIAQAGNDWRDNRFVDYAKVTQVEPIVETIEHQGPREECWNEQVRYTPEPRYHGHGRHERSATPVILGALIGGALGNELGHHKRNKQVGAVAGAILGGSIGADIRRQHHREVYRQHRDDAAYDVAYRTEKRCKTYYDSETEQRVTGYDVSYRYQGHEYSTWMADDPGKRLRVHVAVSPVQ